MTVDFIRFIFSSFWIWVGFALLIVMIGNAIAEVIKAIRGPKGGDDA